MIFEARGFFSATYNFRLLGVALGKFKCGARKFICGAKCKRETLLLKLHFQSINIYYNKHNISEYPSDV